MKPCTVDGCGRTLVAKGFCPMHYDRWQKTGDPGPAHNLRKVRFAQLMEQSRRGPDECWEWVGCVANNGYGRFGRSSISVHRASYESANGPIPDGMVVRHACDNPPCCNPSHLVVGSQADNSRDMVERNRQARGEGVNTARLTAADARAIRETYLRGGVTQVQLAEQYGVSQGSISAVVRRKSWTWLDRTDAA